MAHLERCKHTLGNLEAEPVDEGVFISDDSEDLAEAEDSGEAFEGVGVVRVGLDAADQGLDVARVIFQLFLRHLLEAPLGELGHRVAANLSQGRVVPARCPLNERVEQALDLGVLVDTAAREPSHDLED